MATSKPSHQLYRSLLRQYKDASVQPRTSRSPSIASALRRLFDGKAGATAAPSDAGGITARQVSDLAGYMKANRLHSVGSSGSLPGSVAHRFVAQDLVKRYNPGTDLTEPERIKA